MTGYQHGDIDYAYNHNDIEFPANDTRIESVEKLE